MGYGTVSRLLHWVMAVMILVMIPVGLTMIQEGLERSTQDRSSSCTRTWARPCSR
jgi:cytochrome b561